MNKVLILSDSHGLTDELTMIKERHQLEYMIHCGDSELRFNAPELQGFYVIKGNCDNDHRFEEDLVMKIGGLTFFITHGHLYNVRPNLLNIAYKAKELEADIICYGHTHVAYAEQVGNQLFINPGSIRYPKGYNEKTYVIMKWETFDNVTITFYTMEGSIIPELSFEVSSLPE